MGLWRNLRAALELADRVNSLEDHIEQLTIEWADKREAFDRLLRRLTMRDARSAPVSAPDQPEDAGDRKVALRRRAFGGST